jgi:hypothetical protein
MTIISRQHMCFHPLSHALSIPAYPKPVPLTMSEPIPSPPSIKTFPFLHLPFEIRQQIYTHTLSTTLSITDSRLSRSPSLEEIAFVASRRGTWNLILTSRLIYSETLNLRWENLTIAFNKDGTRSTGDDGRHRLGNADQAFRRRIRHLEISDPECFGMCYGLRQLSGLKSLVLNVEKVDGLLLEPNLMVRAYRKELGILPAEGRTLRVEVQIVEPPGFEVGMFTSATTTSPEVQRQWRQDAVRREGLMPYLWLGDTIWNLPAGCRVTIQAKVTKVTWDILKDLRGFIATLIGRDSWTLTYDQEI